MGTEIKKCLRCDGSGDCRSCGGTGGEDGDCRQCDGIGICSSCDGEGSIEIETV